MRVGAAQPRARLVDWRLTNPADVLARIDRSLVELEQIVRKAGTARCDALAFPEDTLGLGNWEAAHKTAPGAWNFYAYWPEMKGSADGRFWGNSVTPSQPALVLRDRWQCVEVMVQCNSRPEKSDGQLALWLDGTPVMHIGPGSRRSHWTGMGFSIVEQGGEAFEGFRWRTSADLQVNFLWLLHYVTENAPRQNHLTAPNPINRVWFDDIVVSTEYVGPIRR